ncbi:MAG: outer membrane beta-barrel protein [Gammaproteobacteria bacterium]
MKLKVGHTLAGLVLATVGFSTHAENYYVGLKAGSMMIRVGGFDNAVNGGVNLGYAFGDYSNAPAIEAEYTGSVSDGDISINGAKGKWSVDTFALYGVYRFGGDLYGKVKVGYLNDRGTASGPGGTFSGTDKGASAGVGGGWKLAPQMAIEAEYTRIESDVDFLSVGFNYLFY